MASLPFCPCLSCGQFGYANDTRRRPWPGHRARFRPATPGTLPIRGLQGVENTGQQKPVGGPSPELRAALVYGDERGIIGQLLSEYEHKTRADRRGLRERLAQIDAVETPQVRQKSRAVPVDQPAERDASPGWLVFW
jgi:hypothetical protein